VKNGAGAFSIDETSHSVPLQGSGFHYQGRLRRARQLTAAFPALFKTNQTRFRSAFSGGWEARKDLEYPQIKGDPDGLIGDWVADGTGTFADVAGVVEAHIRAAGPDIELS
jgi:hypothetical protein